MGKNVIYTVIIFIALVILNWFEIISVPWLDISDFTTEPKQEIISKSHDLVKLVE